MDCGCTAVGARNGYRDCIAKILLIAWTGILQRDDEVVLARETIYTNTFSHFNPIPVACRIDNLVVTGAVAGFDLKTGELPLVLEEQCANIFLQIPEIMKQSGGGIEHIIKINIWHDGAFHDPYSRDVLNKEWLKMFPDSANRPARQTMQSKLPPGHWILADLMAVISERK